MVADRAVARPSSMLPAEASSAPERHQAARKLYTQSADDVVESCWRGAEGGRLGGEPLKRHQPADIPLGSCS